MKKFLACLIMICCVVSCFTLSANAAEVCGQKITVTLSTNTACGGLQGALECADFENLIFKNATVNSAIAGHNALESSISNSNGKTRFALVGDVKSGTSGNWLTLEYSYLSGSNVQFTEKSFKAFDVTGNPTNISIAKNVSVTKTVYLGDANDDGALDIRDLVKMNDCKESEFEDELQNKCFDFNKSGSWDFDTDMPAFRKYLLS